MNYFSKNTRRWFQASFKEPTPIQKNAWPVISSGLNSLLIAPTGCGKTLAAFLYSIDYLIQLGNEHLKGIHTLYISPLKALAHDIERNLRIPIREIVEEAERAGIQIRVPSIAVRSGDTSSNERRAQVRKPSDILVTTPESLYLLLGSQAAETLRTVKTVIIDEVHALAPTKRGAHLALSLERLCEITLCDPQRIGLSATVRPIHEMACFIGGNRPMQIIDNSCRPLLDLQVRVPVQDMTRPLETSIFPNNDNNEKGIWHAIYPQLIELIHSHCTTIIFVNSRGLCERLCQRLNQLAGENLVRSHHGSLSQEERRDTEEQLKNGAISGIVSTSSLELGIDMGTIDLVVLVESPGSVAHGLQRIGRAGHSVSQLSKGYIIPKHRSDLLESTVLIKRMLHGEIEKQLIPNNPLDVLAQQIVAIVSTQACQIESLEKLIKRTYTYRDLPHSVFIEVLEMLSGRYPPHSVYNLPPRIIWDRKQNVLSARRGSKMVSLINGGTIPDRGLYSVYLSRTGQKLGELDEEMVHETLAGQIFSLGAGTWRIEEITHDRVIVSPAPGETGKPPFWHGDKPGRSVELGKALGQFIREIATKPPEQVISWLKHEYRLDTFAAHNLINYIDEQLTKTGTLPTDQKITIERFRDELGDYRVCILSPLGARVHAPWALILQAKLGKTYGFKVQSLFSDDGIVLHLPRTLLDSYPDYDLLVPVYSDIEEHLIPQLLESELFASQFRENAARTLLLPRRRPKSRTPLWVQRIKSAELLAATKEYSSFPVIVETYRTCLQDIFDLPALTDLIKSLASQKVIVEQVDTRHPSPFARSLMFDFIATYLYKGDTPLAEYRAQVLQLDRDLLRELLGEERPGSLLDEDVIQEIEDELQSLVPYRKIADKDSLHDLLLRIGDLTEEEVILRSKTEVRNLFSELLCQNRIIPIIIAQQKRWIASEDQDLYLANKGLSTSSEIPEACISCLSDGYLEILLRRFSRTHGPFFPDQFTERYGLHPKDVDSLIKAMESQGVLTSLGPKENSPNCQYCESKVYRRIKHETLAKLRAQIEPVTSRYLAMFLSTWHGTDGRSTGLTRLQKTICQLEGLALPFKELETVILPTRVADFKANMLDELSASGWLSWVGCGKIGSSDGRVMLFRRERVSALLNRPSMPEDLKLLQKEILNHLKIHGASFFNSIQTSCSQTTQAEILKTLKDLIWLGLVTNDTLMPLRVSSKQRFRSPRTNNRFVTHSGIGRYSLVSDLIIDPPNQTERAHKWTNLLIQRHGIVTTAVTRLELLPFGFDAIFTVLKTMEESGKIRQGYFVDNLPGVQFASAITIERLRQTRSQGNLLKATVLSTIDPANPYGWLFPWPVNHPSNATVPKRISGSKVILVAGEPLVYLAKGLKRMHCFPAINERSMRKVALEALRKVAYSRRGRLLHLTEIDYQPAQNFYFLEDLKAVGFSIGYRGIELQV